MLIEGTRNEAPKYSTGWKKVQTDARKTTSQGYKHSISPCESHGVVRGFWVLGAGIGLLVFFVLRVAWLSDGRMQDTPFPIGLTGRRRDKG